MVSYCIFLIRYISVYLLFSLLFFLFLVGAEVGSDQTRIEFLDFFTIFGCLTVQKILEVPLCVDLVGRIELCWPKNYMMGLALSLL